MRSLLIIYIHPSRPPIYHSVGWPSARLFSPAASISGSYFEKLPDACRLAFGRCISFALALYLFVLSLFALLLLAKLLLAATYLSRNVNSFLFHLLFFLLHSAVLNRFPYLFSFFSRLLPAHSGPASLFHRVIHLIGGNPIGNFSTQFSFIFFMCTTQSHSHKPAVCVRAVQAHPPQHEHEAASAIDRNGIHRDCVVHRTAPHPPQPSHSRLCLIYGVIHIHISYHKPEVR